MKETRNPHKILMIFLARPKKGRETSVGAFDEE